MSARRRLTWLAVVCVVLAACSPSPSGTPEPSAAPAAPTVSPTARPTMWPEPTPTAIRLLPDDALLPNLVMEPLDEWRIEIQEGRRLLRMTTIFSNYGSGAFELRGGRASVDETMMTLDQVVYTASGEERLVPTSVKAQFAGDGHDHWHAQRVVTMQLSNVADPGTIRFGSKIAFCFLDDVRANTALPGYSSEPHYLRAWCGDPSSLMVTMGVSVGWGDRYGWDFAYQWVDITGMAGGTYLMRATVDYADDFLETDDTDNCTMSRVTIPASGEGLIVNVEANGLDC